MNLNKKAYLIVLCILITGIVMPKKLKEYSQKRNFEETTEPKPAPKHSKSGNLFVVQQHAASHMHFDFRLEVEGVLASWAIPKGPSLDPHIKRLAVMTEDHPLEYAHFEGIIPEGNYGAGAVIVWDIGTYENLKKDSMTTCLNRGIIEIHLNGEKLKGNFALVRTGNKESKNWLLIKLQDKFASDTKDLVASKKKSVLSGKTIKHLEKLKEKK